MIEPSNPYGHPDDGPVAPGRKRSLLALYSRPYIAIGATLWVLCFAVLAVGLIGVLRKPHSNPSENPSVSSEEDNGKSKKQIRLVPRQGGGFDIKTEADGIDESPWEAEGIADFSFTDCNGQSVTKQSLLGKPFIIGFIFTNCRGPCPNVTLQMQELQNRLKEFEFNLVTLTVDPARDTAETLREYGKNYGADFERWKFLTGDQNEIYRLIQQSFKMPVEETKGPDRTPGFEIIHSRNLMLVDETGRVVGKYDALKEDDMARLRKELKRLAKPNVRQQAAGGENDRK